MDNSSIHPPLSNIQVELLKLFFNDIPDKYLVELKQLVAQFLLEKGREKADTIWEEKVIPMKSFSKF